MPTCRTTPPAETAAWTAGPRHRAGLTFVELLIVMIVLIILMALLLPVCQRLREFARLGRCSRNQAQIGIALQKFQDLNGTFPIARGSREALLPLLEEQDDVFDCPSALACGDAGTSYGFNMCLNRLMDESGKIALCDAFVEELRWANADFVTWEESVAPRHIGVMNVLHVDGSVRRSIAEAINPYLPQYGAEIASRLWKPRRGCGPDTRPDCRGGGLVAEYWSDSTWSKPKGGPPDIVRVDKSMCLPFGEAHAATVWGNYPFPTKRYAADTNGNGLSDCAFQARWRGFVKVPTTGNYRFIVRHDDTVWIDVGGVQRFYATCCTHDGSGRFGNFFHLQAGIHPIEIRFDNIWWLRDYLEIRWENDCGMALNDLDASDLACP